MDLENKILVAIKESINEAIKNRLEGYSSPLSTLIDNGVNENRGEIQELINEGFSQALKSKDMRNQIKEAMRHKIARTLISKMDGTVDKAINELRSDPVSKAKLTVAIENVLREFREKI